MNNKKSTKRALLSSVLSLVICMTMLIGTTFAWFTDSVTSTNNIIKSGNLDVELEYSTDMKNWNKVTETTNIFKEGALWEPGYTEVVYLRVSNLGSLALKYNLGVNVASEDEGTNKAGETFKLSNYIEFGVIDPVTAAFSGREAARAAVTDAKKIAAGYTKEASLLAKAEGATEYPTDVVAMVVYMPETVGNEANHNGDAPEIKLGLNLLATQFTAEEDSFDKYYDESAIYYDVKASTPAELADAIKAGEEVIAVDGSIALTSSLNASGVTFVGLGANATIDFGTQGISGSDITYKNLTLDNDRAGWYKGMEHGNALNNTYIDCTFVNGITTYGNSTFKNCTFNELPAGNYALFVYGGKNITVEGCTFNYGNRAIKIYNEGYTPDVTVSVSNTVFKASDTTVANKAMIEIDDSLMNSVKVTVNDITIDSKIAAQGVYRINDGALDTSTEKSVVSVDGVVTTAKANNQTEFSEALANGSEVAVELSAGTYTIPSTVANKDITITGSGDDTVFDFTKVNTATNASITFENVKFQGKNENVMNGYGIQGTTGHIAYKNCTFDGAVTNEYYGTVSYENCTFTGTGYITTYAVKSATFENCVFDKADSRAVLVYSHGDNPVVVSIKDCTFKAAAKATTWAGDWTAAIEVDTTNIKTAGTTVTVEECTFDSNYSGLVRDKSAANATPAVITIDGVTQ